MSNHIYIKTPHPTRRRCLEKVELKVASYIIQRLYTVQSTYSLLSLLTEKSAILQNTPSEHFPT